MLPLLPILGLVANYAPDIIGLFSKDKGAAAEKALSAATGVIESITGKKGDEAVAAIEGSPELQLAFQKALMADKHIDEQMRYADRGNARDMYKHHHGMQDQVAKQIMSQNLWFVMTLVMANVAIMVFVPNDFAAAMQGVGTLIGMVINSLLKERQDLVGFNFGSSTGSKLPKK